MKKMIVDSIRFGLIGIMKLHVMNLVYGTVTLA